MDLQQTADAIRGLVDNVERAVAGKRSPVTLAVVALFAGEHLLVEDVPGVGKTVLARAVARSIDGTFRRVQGTSDLLPGDVTGTTVWNQATAQFTFSPGPVFTNVLLIDEINRVTPKAQSALLEALEERRVSVDGQAYDLPRPFFAVATLNPIEQHGTFPLPEGELDRFGLSISLGYPDSATERQVVRAQMLHHPIDDVEPVLTGDQLLQHQAAVRTVHLSDEALDYALAVVRETRADPDLELGASPRGSLTLTRAAQAMALVRGRDYVTPDDVKTLAPAALAHRIIPTRPRLGLAGAREIVGRVVKRVPAPR